MRFTRYSALAFAFAAMLAACDGMDDNFCTTDDECRDGEFCDLTSARCRCGDRDPADPAGGTSRVDACGEADPQTICNAATDRCEPRCETSAECRTGQVCNLTTNLCEDEETTDCTQDEDACGDDQVCDPTSKACVDPCSESSCGNNRVCNTETQLCENDCTVTGFVCPGGERCNTTTRMCEQGCGAESCDAASEVCDPVLLECIPRCDLSSGATVCDSGEYCDDLSGACIAMCVDSGDCDSTQACAEDGRCVDRCTGHDDCSDDQFCDLTSGLCEEQLDIAECNPKGVPLSSSNPRQFVDELTNSCEPTELLEACSAASNRSSGNVESPNGPTLFRATQIGVMNAQELADAGGCAKGVKILAEYWDPSGNMLGTSSSVRNTTILQAAATNAPSALPIVTCTGSTPGCGGIKSDDHRGAFIFALCRLQSAPATETLAVYARDRNDSAFGNTICFDVNNP